MLNNLIVGAHCIAHINSRRFANVISLDYDITSVHKENRGIDYLMPTELTPISLSLSGSMQIYRLHRDGGIEADGMIPDWGQLTRGKYFSLMILDRSTDTIILEADKCVIQKQSWRVATKAFVMGTIGFSGLVYKNESSVG